ncbi:MAG TPA: hypothetical protein VJN92_01405 [Candidatus Acidoferrum sp.]|nr:hypothetical protein [Candidatus Acidoferrum sp.]
MGKAKIVLGLAVLGLAVIAGWKIGACELANIELQSDLRDISSQIGVRIGLNDLISDDEIRNVVIRRAEKYDIQLEPAQVTVQHPGTGAMSDLYLAVDYKTPVNLLGCSFTLHFTPSSRK